MAVCGCEFCSLRLIVLFWCLFTRFIVRICCYVVYVFVVAVVYLHLVVAICFACPVCGWVWFGRLALGLFVVRVLHLGLWVILACVLRSAFGCDGVVSCLICVLGCLCIFCLLVFSGGLFIGVACRWFVCAGLLVVGILRMCCRRIVCWLLYLVFDACVVLLGALCCGVLSGGFCWFLLAG